VSPRDWATTWRDIIVPLLAPKPTHAWWQQSPNKDRIRVALRPSMDADLRRGP
jgi:hypothetical protein